MYCIHTHEKLKTTEKPHFPPPPLQTHLFPTLQISAPLSNGSPSPCQTFSSDGRGEISSLFGQGLWRASLALLPPAKMELSPRKDLPEINKPQPLTSPTEQEGGCLIKLLLLLFFFFLSVPSAAFIFILSFGKLRWVCEEKAPLSTPLEKSSHFSTSFWVFLPSLSFLSLPWVVVLPPNRPPNAPHIPKKLFIFLLFSVLAKKVSDDGGSCCHWQLFLSARTRILMCWYSGCALPEWDFSKMTSSQRWCHHCTQGSFFLRLTPDVTLSPNETFRFLLQTFRSNVPFFSSSFFYISSIILLLFRLLLLFSSSGLDLNLFSLVLSAPAVLPLF